MSDQDQQQTNPGEEPERNPFLDVVIMLFNQGLLGLGAAPDPTQGKVTVNLPLAQFIIDAMAALEEKTKGNLSDEEQRLLAGALDQLRRGYVERARQGAPEQAQEEQTEESASRILTPDGRPASNAAEKPRIIIP